MSYLIFVRFGVAKPKAYGFNGSKQFGIHAALLVFAIRRFVDAVDAWAKI
jgi:hypothetical protein